MKTLANAQKMLRDIFFTYQKEKRIVSLHADSNYTNIHLSTGKKITSSYTLGFFKNYLDECMFTRVNRGTIVCKQYVKSIEKTDSGLYVLLETGKAEKVSRRREDLVLKELKKVLL